MNTSSFTREKIDTLFVQAWKVEKEGDFKTALIIYECASIGIADYKKGLGPEDLEPVVKLEKDVDEHIRQLKEKIHEKEGEEEKIENKSVSEEPEKEGKDDVALTEVDLLGISNDEEGTSLLHDEEEIEKQPLLPGKKKPSRMDKVKSSVGSMLDNLNKTVSPFAVFAEKYKLEERFDNTVIGFFSLISSGWDKIALHSDKVKNMLPRMSGWKNNVLERWARQGIITRHLKDGILQSSTTSPVSDENKQKKEKEQELVEIPADSEENLLTDENKDAESSGSLDSKDKNDSQSVKKESEGEENNNETKEKDENEKEEKIDNTMMCSNSIGLLALNNESEGSNESSILDSNYPCLQNSVNESEEKIPLIQSEC